MKLHVGCAIGLLWTAVACGSPFPTTLVVGTGDKFATPIGDVWWSGFFGGQYQQSALAEDGTMVFGGLVQDESGKTIPGYWSYAGGNFHLLAAQGQAAQGLSSGVYTKLEFPPAISPNGKAVFSSLVYEPGEPELGGIWSGVQPPIGLVVGPMQPAPMIGQGVSFYSAGGPTLTAQGRINFLSGLEGPGINSSNNVVLMQSDAGSLRVIARTGDAAVGMPGFFHSSLTFPMSQGSEDGRTFFWSQTKDPLTGNTRYGVWRETDAGHQLVYGQYTTTAPGYSDGTVFATFLPKISQNGKFGLMPNALEGPTITPANDRGWWTWEDGLYQELAREGQPIAFSNKSGRVLGNDTSSMDAVSINDLGTSFFSMSTDDGGTKRDSYVLRKNGVMTWLLDRGDQAPGLTAGTKLDYFLYVSDINNSDLLVLGSQLSGLGVNKSNDNALFLLNTEGEFELIAREGSLFEYQPGLFATITALPGEFGFIGSVSSLADSGQYIFSMQFDNGFIGLYSTTVPAVPSLAVLLFGAHPFVRRRRASLPNRMPARRVV